jgi:hypothetical protein
MRLQISHAAWPRPRQLGFLARALDRKEESEPNNVEDRYLPFRANNVSCVLLTHQRVDVSAGREREATHSLLTWNSLVCCTDQESFHCSSLLRVFTTSHSWARCNRINPPSNSSCGSIWALITRRHSLGSELQGPLCNTPQAPHPC